MQIYDTQMSREVRKSGSRRDSRQPQNISFGLTDFRSFGLSFYLREQHLQPPPVNNSYEKNLHRSRYFSFFYHLQQQ